MKNKLVLTIIFVSLLFLGADAVGNPEKVAGIVGISSYWIATTTVFLLIVLRLKKYVPFSGTWLKLLSLAAVLMMAAAAAATIFDYHSPPNTFFSLTRLHQSRLLLIGLYLSHVALLSQSDQWWKKLWKPVFFLYPFAMFGCILLVRLLPFDRFFHIAKEDTLFEMIQLCILLIGMAIAAWFTRFFAKTKSRTSLLFLALSLGMFFVAGEEISWGQRIFNIEPTETIQAVNYQSEYTLHNLHIVHHKVFDVYVILCLLAITVTWVTRLVPALKKFTPYMPSWLLLGYFLVPLPIYFGQMQGTVKLPWAEAVEMFFYAGVSWWILQLGLVFSKNKLIHFKLKK